MTTFGQRNIRCAICRVRNTYQELRKSTHTVGYPALDGRPSPMERDDLFYRVLQCPTCGYCSPDPSQATPQAALVVAGDRYRAIWKDESLPEMARTWLCYSLLEEAEGYVVNAGWSAVQAAWACDDEQDQYHADEIRRCAVLIFWQCVPRGLWFVEDEGSEQSEQVVLADLLRRSGDFQGAIAVCEVAAWESLSDEASQILAFEKTLAEREDRGCYTIDQVLMLPELEANKQPDPEDELSEEERHTRFYVQEYFKHLITDTERKAVSELWGREPNTFTLQQSIVERILREHAGEVYANRCPKCGRLPRTPRARQCCWCYYDWHEI